MFAHTVRTRILTSLLLAAGLAGCRAAPLDAPEGRFVSGSASADNGWTTPGRPTSIATPVTSPQTWSDGIVTRSTEPAYRGAPPPPPPPGTSVPVVVAPPPPTTMAAPTPVPPPPSPAPVMAPAPARTWSGCGLPCASGLSQWHVRGVIGWAFWEGTDAPEDCLYWGVDLGRTFCGCWGLDLFYRYSSASFPRFVPPGQSGTKDDGGVFHHVGAKFTYEFGFGDSRFYGWAGLGGEYYWSQDYIVDSDGFGVFGELGIGYVINQNFRIRAGLNAHWLIDTNTGRFDPADDDEGRDLFILAPVIEAEFAW